MSKLMDIVEDLFNKFLKMYSLLGRGNYVLYNALIALFVCGCVNHIMVRWGHEIGVRDGPVTIPAKDINFELKEVN